MRTNESQFSLPLPLLLLVMVFFLVFSLCIDVFESKCKCYHNFRAAPGFSSPKEQEVEGKKRQQYEWQPSKIIPATTMNNNFHNFSAFDTPYSKRCVCVRACVYFKYSFLLYIIITLGSLSLALLIRFIVQPTRNSPFTNRLSLQFFTLANLWRTEQTGTEQNRTERNGLLFSAYVRFVLAMNLCYFNIRFCDTEECISGKMNTKSHKLVFCNSFQIVYRSFVSFFVSYRFNSFRFLFLALFTETHAFFNFRCCCLK